MRPGLALLAPLLATLAGCVFVGDIVIQTSSADSFAALDALQIRQLAPPPDPARPELEVELDWHGERASVRLRNAGKSAIPVHDVVLFDFAHGMPGDTAFYGEGFQMLSQTAGTIAHPVDLEQYTDRGHYRIAEPPGFRSVYGVALFSRPELSRLLVGFASCRRFVGRIDVSASHVRAVIDGEGIAIEPGETWELEDLVVAAGPDRDELLARLAYWIGRNHPRRAWPRPPTGWCSWYCFGPDVTAKSVTDSIDCIKGELPELEYVQIDDGYQPAMGDWLETGPSFGGDVKSVIAEIKRRGLKPALWVAPFIASEDSRLFREHPDWFVTREDGKPLRSDAVGFGGWRQAPWYCLDGSNPSVQEHLRRLFQTLSKDWGVEYFKLDANYWGAIHGGLHWKAKTTRVEAYRLGMAAIASGAGESFLLACNHPMWPSLGLIHGSRSSMDVDRNWESITRVGRQALLRSWQNDRLWWNDPDCVLLADPSGARDQELSFHLALQYATGGMTLSGDDLVRLPLERIDLLRQLMQRPPSTFTFGDDLECGTAPTPCPGNLRAGTTHVLLNWTDRNQVRHIRSPGSFGVEHVLDAQGRRGTSVQRCIDGCDLDLPARSGRVITVWPGMREIRFH